jgi:hypothetical protein
MMTDVEVREHVERADAFIEQLRIAISETVVDPTSSCTDEARRGLQRVAEPLDAVPYVTFANLANLNIATKGMIMELATVKLLAVGGGPILDYADATSFLAQFQPIIDVALKRRIN